MRKLASIERKFYRIWLAGFNAVMAYHTSFYLTPLSFVCMVCVCCILFVMPRFLLILILVLGAGITRGEVLQVGRVSELMMIVLYPLSIWVTLI